MPIRARGRSTVSWWQEVCLPMAAGQKDEPPKGLAFPLLGVSKTALLKPDVLVGG
jgi:hypothetical protein